MAENDQWSKWLLEARFGGDKQACGSSTAFAMSS